MSETDDIPTEVLRHAVLSACFERGSYTYAQGVEANNKLDVEKINAMDDLREEVVYQVGKLVLSHDVDFVVGVPNGANWLAGAIAHRFTYEQVILKRENEHIAFENDFIDGAVILPHVDRGVLVEDVFNNFTRSRQTLAFEPISSKIVAAVSLFDRGDPESRAELEIPYESVITEHIPAKLADDSPVWQFVK